MEKLSSNEIKIQNRQLIYQFIRAKKQASKQDIVVGLQLSLPTVTQNLEYLKAQELIDTSMKIKNTGGRNATAYSYVQDAKVAVGIYITSKYISAVAVDMSGEIVGFKRERIDFNLDDDEYLKKLGEIVENIAKETKASDKILGVGIAVPGLVSADGERVIYGLTLGFTGKRREEIAKYIPYESRLFHDSYVAGYMEAWKVQKARNGFYISLSNSVGGSVIVDSIIYKGNTQKGGEIGHMTVVPKGGKRCYCGKKGCFDTVCNTGVLEQHANGSLNGFFELLKTKDQKAMEVWDEYLDNLALAIHNIRMLFDGTIILGGYLSPYISEYMEDIRKRVDERNPFGDQAEEYLLECECKVEAAAAGAALYFIERFMNNI